MNVNKNPVSNAPKTISLDMFKTPENHIFQQKMKRM